MSKEFSLQVGVNNNILRMNSMMINSFDSKLKELERYMWDCLKTSNGVGLAAPQVGENKRMFIIDYNDFKFTAFNPVITKMTKKTSKSEEGCLSLPGVFGDVLRSNRVVLSYQDILGKKHNINLTDWHARIAQHELDHLNGVLFIDKIDGDLRVAKDVDYSKIGLELD